jgi:hypothetical protein
MNATDMTATKIKSISMLSIFVYIYLVLYNIVVCNVLQRLRMPSLQILSPLIMLS